MDRLKPQVNYLPKRRALTITLQEATEEEAKDWFLLIADALKDRAIELSGFAREDALFLETVGDSIGRIMNKEYDQ
jgi:hypothetical protein